MKLIEWMRGRRARRVRMELLDSCEDLKWKAKAEKMEKLARWVLDAPRREQKLRLWCAKLQLDPSSRLNKEALLGWVRDGLLEEWR